MGGGGRGGVTLSFRDVRLVIYRAGCLRFPLSLILSPRSAGGARKPEAQGCCVRLKWRLPSTFEMV